MMEGWRTATWEIGRRDKNHASGGKSQGQKRRTWVPECDSEILREARQKRDVRKVEELEQGITGSKSGGGSEAGEV